jgi:D-alanyl-D-alanine carboxypeptidase
MSRLRASLYASILCSFSVACSSASSSGNPADAGKPDAPSEGGARLDAGADASQDAVAKDASDASSPACKAQAASLQSGLEKSLSSATTPGAVLAVSTPACGLWVGAAGTSTKTVPMAATDVLRVGSITKTFVATSVLKLVTAGKVALTDSLEHWLPGFPNGTNITLKELLNHTSGIYDYTDDPTWQSTEMSDPKTVWTPQELVNIAAMHAATFAPGTSWGYSNTDYILLGMLLEKVTGQKAGAVLHADAIDPAALKLTSFPGYEPIKGTLAHGYSTTDEDVSTLFDPSYAWTAGALVASAGDLAQWAVELYGGSILSASALASMLETVPTGQTGEDYGLGVFVLEPALTGGGVAYGHPGDINGYHSQMFYFPDKKVAIVGIVNSDSGDPNAISLVALDLLMP